MYSVLLMDQTLSCSTCVHSHAFPPSYTTASAQISPCLGGRSSWMTTNQVKFKPCKTELLVISDNLSPGQDLAKSLQNDLISPSGLTMNNQSSFSTHVDNVTGSYQFLIYNIRRTRPFLSTQAAQVLVL